MKAKTILAACLAAALTVFPLAGCSNSSDHNSSSGESLSSDGLVDQYPDGTYRAEASEFSHDWKEYVVITVKDGKLTSVEFDAENKAKDAKKSDDEAYKQTMIDGNKANGKPETYPEKFYKELSDSLMNASGDVDKVETVAGATTSSNSFRALARLPCPKRGRATLTPLLSIPVWNNLSFKLKQRDSAEQTAGSLCFCCSFLVLWVYANTA